MSYDSKKFCEEWTASVGQEERDSVKKLAKEKGWGISDLAVVFSRTMREQALDGVDNYFALRCIDIVLSEIDFEEIARGLLEG